MTVILRVVIRDSLTGEPETLTLPVWGRLLGIAVSDSWSLVDINELVHFKDWYIFESRILERKK